MSDMMWLYLLTRLDGLSFFFAALTFCGALAIVIVLLCSIDAGKSEKPFYNKLIMRFTIATFIMGFISIMIPSTKNAMLILGGAALLDVARTDDAKRLAGKSVQVIEKFLDGQLQQSEKK